MFLGNWLVVVGGDVVQAIHIERSNDQYRKKQDLIHLSKFTQTNCVAGIRQPFLLFLRS